ncbi:MAG TPA: metal ABC transporter substrate-binding protein [Propionibacteriaceae bacterium]
MVNFPRPLGAALLAGACLLATACGGGTGAASSEQPGQLNIVVAFYPFQFIAERVAGSHATVESLTQPGSEPHDLELTPRQVGSLGDADLVIYEKTFQPAVDEAVAQSNNGSVLDTASVVPLEAANAEDLHEEEPGHEHGDESGLDPHVWLDPANMATITAEVARRLIEADAEHADDYTANAKALTEQLGALDNRFQTGLASCARTEFITTHAAFGYLAARYNLTQIGISGLSPEAEPSPARIAEVQTEAKEHGVTTIFYETLVSPAVATSMAGDLGLATDVLDPLEGITAQSRGTDYLSVMDANLAALQKAGDCR